MVTQYSRLPYAIAERPAPTSTILIVDDDPAITRMLVMTLQSHGFDVVTAQDGADALECVERAQPDIIILDLAMPVMDGRTFYRHLRDRGVDTPVLILAAHGAHAARHELQCSGFLSKPFLPNDLITNVRTLLDTGQLPATTTWHR